MPTVNSVTYNKPVLPRVSDTSDLASNRASVYSGKALSFDGVNDLVEIQDNGSLDVASNFTYVAYVNLSASQSSKVFVTNYSSSGAVGAGIGISDYTSNVVKFYTKGSGSSDTLYSDFALNTNQWYFVVGTYDGSSKKLYINGVLNNSVAYTDLVTYSSATIRAGALSGVSGQYFNGQISNIKFFDVALTAAQVAELYNNPEQILPTGVSAVNLKLWLPMMEGAGSYVYNGAAGSLGEELVSNGTVDEVCQKWAFTDNGYLAATGGKLVWNAPNGSGSNAVQYIDIEANKTYRVTLDYSVNRDGFGIQLGNVYSTPTLTGTGTYTVDLTPTATNGGYFLLNMSAGTGDLTGYMDNISVKEVVPQATGTISGATWVAGVGEPVPQTALIDWNKASNMLTYSEQLDTDWSRAGTSIAVNETEAPNGFFTADKSTVSNTYVYHDSLLRSVTTVSGVEYETSIYAKKGNGINGIYFYHGNGGRIAKWNLNDGSYIGSNGYTAYSSYGSESVGNGWFRFWARYTASNTSGNFTIGISPNTDNTVVPYTGDGVSYLYLWGAQYVPVSSTGVTPYVSTAATAQTSPVLLPQGLTASKDILGNAIAKPRSAGAFNFDGASWVAVQNNASIKITDSITYELWYYHVETDALNHLIGKRSSDTNWLRIYSHTANTIRLERNGGENPGNDAITENSWNHIVATVDESDVAKIYINGVLVRTVSSFSPWGLDNSGDFTLGAWVSSTVPSSNSYTTGQIANARVYNYALTAEQVADNFNQKASTFGKSSVTSELQAYINRTVAAGATVEAHSALLNTLTELENK